MEWAMGLTLKLSFSFKALMKLNPLKAPLEVVTACCVEIQMSLELRFACESGSFVFELARVHDCVSF